MLNVGLIGACMLLSTYASKQVKTCPISGLCDKANEATGIKAWPMTGKVSKAMHTEVAGGYNVGHLLMGTIGGAALYRIGKLIGSKCPCPLPASLRDRFMSRFCKGTP